MKYIKLFEGFFDFDFGDRLWIEVDWEDGHNTAKTEIPEKLSETEISKILDTFKIIKKHRLIKDDIKTRIVSHRVVKRFPADTEYSCLSLDTESRGNVIICKFSDDRWLVEIFDVAGHFEDSIFLCDSYEGLINWIQDWRGKIK